MPQQSCAKFPHVAVPPCHTDNAAALLPASPSHSNSKVRLASPVTSDAANAMLRGL